MVPRILCEKIAFLSYLISLQKSIICLVNSSTSGPPPEVVSRGPVQLHAVGSSSPASRTISVHCRISLSVGCRKLEYSTEPSIEQFQEAERRDARRFERSPRGEPRASLRKRSSGGRLDRGLSRCSCYPDTRHAPISSAHE